MFLIHTQVSKGLRTVNANERILKIWEVEQDVPCGVDGGFSIANSISYYIVFVEGHEGAISIV